MIVLVIFCLALALVPLARADNANVTLCVPDPKCDQGACHNDNIFRCVTASDTNHCANATYNISSLDSVCAYAAPKGVALETSANTSQMQAANDVKITGPGSKVDYTGENLNISAINFTTVVVKEREVSINNPELNKPALLTFYGIDDGWHIYRNGHDCLYPTCSNINYNKYTRVLTFEVSGFSTYYIGKYTISDLKNIVVDGIGTFLAELVYWVDLAIIAAVAFFGAKIISEYRK